MTRFLFGVTGNGPEYYEKAYDSMTKPLHTSNRPRVGHGQHRFRQQSGRVPLARSGTRAAANGIFPSHWEPGMGYSETIPKATKVAGSRHPLRPFTSSRLPVRLRRLCRALVLSCCAVAPARRTPPLPVTSCRLRILHDSLAAWNFTCLACEGHLRRRHSLQTMWARHVRSRRCLSSVVRRRPGR